jgi:nucleoside diphosphate kinase
LWQEARKNVELEETQSLSQEDYQDRVKRAIVSDLVNQINEGKITAFDLTDEEAKAVEEYLKAENDSKDNPSQSA